ncbi:MAG TPA: adenosylcobinamide-GDP ribazoletransferase, partial [Roseiflexaceae bacterium]|nr:adenosylcobinamide-GDP ribazoletransferase [Roseiflexaceae bacterium]
SDTFDGVLSWRSRERKLEIMRDSRIGAMGALALIAVLLLKVALIAAAGDQWWQIIVPAVVLGRWADVYGIVRFPAAREGGLGRNFQQQLRRGDFGFATFSTIALVLVGGVQGLIAMGCVWLAAELIGRWWVHDLGGLTGDTYGALCEIGEVVALAALIAVWQGG